MTHPQRSGDLAETYLIARFLEHGWIANKLTVDYGEDLLVRIFRSGLATSLSFFVQSRATSHQSPRNRSSDAVRISFPTARLRHWSGYIEPVLIVRTIWGEPYPFWLCVQEYLELHPDTLAGSKYATLDIPRTNILDSKGLRAIEMLVEDRHRFVGRAAAAATELMHQLNSRSGAHVAAYDVMAGVVILDHPDGHIDLILLDGSTRLGPLASILEKLDDSAMNKPVLVKRGNTAAHEVAGINVTWEETDPSSVSSSTARVRGPRRQKDRGSK